MLGGDEMKNKRKYFAVGAFILLVIVLTSATYAAFSDKGKLSGSSFSVGSSDIKLLADISQGTESANLVDELPGPAFVNIGPTWQQNYLMKFYNKSTAPINLTTHAKYATADDPSDLRQYIYVEPKEWDDANNNGSVDTGEEGASLGKKTIVKWSTEGFDLGAIAMGTTKSLILKFTAETLSDTKQGKSGTFDFEFDAINQ